MEEITENERKRNTIIFTAITSLCNVALTLLLAALLLLIGMVICYTILKFQTSLAAQIIVPVSLVLSLVLDFILSIRLIRLCIKKFNLQDKINKKIAEQYLYTRHSNDKRSR